MFIGPITLLCAGWFFLFWVFLMLLSILLNGAFKKTIKASSVIWIVPMIIGVAACFKGV